MSYIGPTTEFEIATSDRKTFKIFLTQQVGSYWVATILYAKNGQVATHNVLGSTKKDAYEQAVAWTIGNIDKDAVVDDFK